MKFEDLAKILFEDYLAKGRRSIGRVEDAVLDLQRFFAGVRANQIGSDLIARYVRSRQEEGEAPTTINTNSARRGAPFGSRSWQPSRPRDRTFLFYPSAIDGKRSSKLTTRHCSTTCPITYGL